MTDSLEGKWRYLVRVLVLRDGNLNRVRKLCWKKNNPCDQEHLVMILGKGYELVVTSEGFPCG